MCTNFFSPEKIGANIKRLIKESKFESQDKFALACNKNSRTVSRWITDGIDNIDTLNLVARTLEVDVRAILF